MKVLKTVISLLAAMLIFVMPLTVGATGESSDTLSTDTASGTSSVTETVQEFSLTFECKINGNVPKDTEFVFGVTVGDYVWDTVENIKATDNFIINTKDNVDGKKAYSFPDNISDGGLYYKFKLSSVSNKSAIVDPIEVEVYFAETGVKAEILKDGLPIGEFVDEPAVVTFNCTAAPEVKISTEGCEAVSKVYDGKLNATVTDKNYKLSGIAEGHEVKLTYDKAEFDSADVKKATKITVSGLKLSGKDADKYALSVDKFEIKGTVTPRPLTVTADNLVMTLGQDEPVLTYKLSEELISGNSAVGALARAAGNEVGTYAVTRGTLSFGDNYEVTFVDGSLTVSSFGYQEVQDPASSVKISGHFAADATLKVTALDPESVAYTTLANGTSWGKIVSSYDIVFTSDGFDGSLTIAIPVESQYEGKEIAVYQQMSNGSIACFKSTVLGGFVTVTTDECSQFMLVADKDKAAEEGSSVGMTILKVIIIILAVIIGLALVIALFFFGMIFFNKTEQLKAIIRSIRRLLKK